MLHAKKGSFRDLAVKKKKGAVTARETRYAG
jgi:hypothetical protein